MFPFTKKEEIKHNWKFIISKLSEDHEDTEAIFKCSDCHIFKTKFIRVGDEHDCKLRDKGFCDCAKDRE